MGNAKATAGSTPTYPPIARARWFADGQQDHSGKFKGKTSMKKVLVVAAMACSVMLFVTGCSSTRHVGGVKSLGIVETAGNDSNKGYVEFISVSKDTPIPIYQLDKGGESYLLGGVGLSAKDTYSLARHDNMPVVENLRVSEPPGTHTFVIERNGERLRVPVQEGKITPVEINYATQDEGDTFRTYRVSHRVFEPVPYQEEKLGCACDTARK
jgi:hypothetical protein